MHVRKLCERLFVELPVEVVERLGLKDGDDVLVDVAEDGTIRVYEDDRRAAALARLKGLAWAAPAGFRFDRDEANGNERRARAVADLRARAPLLFPDYKFDRDEANSRLGVLSE